MFALTYKNWLKGLGSPEGAFLKSPLWRIPIASPRIPLHYAFVEADGEERAATGGIRGGERSVLGGNDRPR